MAKVKGLGTLLKRASTTIAQRVTLSGPGMEMGEVDCTDLDSTAKETAPTIFDTGEISGTCFYDPDDTTHETMLADIQAGTISLWTLTFATTVPVTMGGNGFVKSFEPTGMEIEGLLQANFTIRLDGTGLDIPDGS